MKDCGIVKDLLPLYAEDMASEESAAFVRTHLEICEDCRKAYEEMKAPVETEPAAPLKTVRKAVKKRGLLIAGVIAALAAALLLGVFARLTKPIPVTSSGEAFDSIEIRRKSVEIVEGADIHLRNVAVVTPDPEGFTMPGTEETEDSDTELVKAAQQQILVIVDGVSQEQLCYVVLPDGKPALTDTVYTEQDAETTPKPYGEVSFQIVVGSPDTERDAEATPEPYSEVELQIVAETPDTSKEAAAPEIMGIPQRLLLTAEPAVEGIMIEKTGGELFVSAYTTLWRTWFGKDKEPEQAQIALSDVDAVFFEPFNNTEHEVLFQREGYQPEAGFALPRLVMNYYFLIALVGTILLAVVWFILRLLKKQKASNVFGVLLLIAASGVLAFLFAGFPATTIAPARELAFVCVIALLLIGAGLCGRKLLRKE